MTSLRLAGCDSPIGPLALAVGSEGLVNLDLEGDRDRVVHHLERRFRQVSVEDDPDPDGVVTALRRYFDGERDVLDGLRVDPGGTPFQHAVWLTLREIPWGQTWSYGRVAAAVGHVWAARAVGAANGANPLPIVLPCHRVIGGDGRLVGYGGGLGRKEWLLRHEGARITVDSQGSLFPSGKLTSLSKRSTLKTS